MLGDAIFLSISYIPYAILLSLTVLILPALALFPQLLRTPLLATSIPIVSILIINTLAILFLAFHVYNHFAVFGTNIVMGLTALFRCSRVRLAWDKSAKYIFLFNAGLLLPLIAFCGIGAFMTNDALTSWNFWALYFYKGVIPGTSGYPPFFPLFISYCYHVLGNTEYQGAVKTLLVFFPFSLINAIAFMNRSTQKHLLLYLILIGICVLPPFFSMYRFYATGYADPMLAAATTISLALYLRYLEDQQKREYLFFGMLCSIVAALSKQPGLFFTCISLPLIFAIQSYRTKKWKAWEWVAISIPFIPALYWLLTNGSHFYQNTGVISASTHQDHITLRGARTALTYSIQHYLLQQPTLLALLIISAISARRAWYKLAFFLVFIVPATLLWFTFGSYDMRLGLYILGAMGLLISSENYLFPKAASMKNDCLPLALISYGTLVGGCILFFIFSVISQYNPHLNTPHRIYPLQAGRSILWNYFGETGEMLYRTIYDNSHVKIWAPQALIGGIFYSHTPIVPAPASYKPDDIYQNIIHYQPDFLIVTLCDRPEEVCDGIKEAIKKYPGLLTLIPIKNAKYDSQVYYVKNMRK